MDTPQRHPALIIWPRCAHDPSVCAPTPRDALWFKTEGGRPHGLSRASPPPLINGARGKKPQTGKKPSSECSSLQTVFSSVLLRNLEKHNKTSLYWGEPGIDPSPPADILPQQHNILRRAITRTQASPGVRHGPPRVGRVGSSQGSKRQLEPPIWICKCHKRFTY